MSRKLVAIIGRPNVGKSTLFNRFLGQRSAIVEDQPGVTRDRNYAEVCINERHIVVVDTGGFDPEPSDIFLEGMKQQVMLAVDEADIILALFDAKDGLTPSDQSMVDMLRGCPKPILWLVNKADNDMVEHSAAEFWSLGMDELHFISASHGKGFGVLCDRIMELLPEPTPDEFQAEASEYADATRVAVIGRPNAGKSTLINRLLGEERLLTSDVPGTTRDSIDTLLTMPDGRRYVFVDTAGIRRKSRIMDRIEKYSVFRAMTAIDRCEVALVILDASRELADQDARIISMVTDSGRALAIVGNKWDLVDKNHKTATWYEKDLRERLPDSAFAPVLFISALTGQRINKIVDLVDRLKASWTSRVKTAEVNRVLVDALRRNPPPVVNNVGRLKFLFAAQVKTAPPAFVIYCNHATAVPMNYRRYLMNRFREEWAFEGAPVRLYFRGRKKPGDETVRKSDQPILAEELLQGPPPEAWADDIPDELLLDDNAWESEDEGSF